MLCLILLKTRKIIKIKTIHVGWRIEVNLTCYLMYEFHMVRLTNDA